MTNDKSLIFKKLARKMSQLSNYVFNCQKLKKLIKHLESPFCQNYNLKIFQHQLLHFFKQKSKHCNL